MSDLPVQHRLRQPRTEFVHERCGQPVSVPDELVADFAEAADEIDAANQTIHEAASQNAALEFAAEAAESERAALRAGLERLSELPCKLGGDTSECLPAPQGGRPGVAEDEWCPSCVAFHTLQTAA